VGQVLYFVPFLDVSSALDGTEIVKEDAWFIDFNDLVGNVSVLG
jgi:hypothetical protein